MCVEILTLLSGAVINSEQAWVQERVWLFGYHVAGACTS